MSSHAPPGAELIHSQEGLEIWRNAKNKFVCCRLSYLADPAKRSEEWLAEAKAGLSDGKFRREYEIEWDALDGQKVFPEIVLHYNQIVVPEGAYTFEHSKVFWAGYDHGMRNPAAFIVFTQDENGVIYAVWELYEPCENMPDFVSKMRLCPYWNRIRYIVADCSMWDKRGYNAEGAPISAYELFVQHGIKNFVRGGRASDVEMAWLLQMRQYWHNPQDIQFKILDSCPNLVEEFKGARYPNMSELQAIANNTKEKMVDKHNHAMDATKYWMTTHRKVTGKRDFNYTSPVYKWRN